MAKILILIDAHLCMFQRPQKEAETLSEAGHDVLVMGYWFDEKLAKKDMCLFENKRWKYI